jgi:hypothetical protein
MTGNVDHELSAEISVDAAVSQFKILVLLGIRLERPRKRLKSRNDSNYLGWDSNRVHPEYKSSLMPTHSVVSGMSTHILTVSNVEAPCKRYMNANGIQILTGCSVKSLTACLFVDECGWSRILAASVSLWRRAGFHSDYRSILEQPLSRQPARSEQCPVHEAISRIVSYLFLRPSAQLLRCLVIHCMFRPILIFFRWYNVGISELLLLSYWKRGSNFHVLLREIIIIIIRW